MNCDPRFRSSQLNFQLGQKMIKQASFASPAAKPWTPWTHKVCFLAPIVLASGLLIAVLQICLERGTRDTGLLFAPKINDLSLYQRSPYLYLPTIASLVLSFARAWFGLDVRRLQPFVELSKERGARAGDSRLLHYPFNFVAFVLFTTAKRQYDHPSRICVLANPAQALASLLGIPSSRGDTLGSYPFTIKYVHDENDRKEYSDRYGNVNVLSFSARTKV